MDSAQPPPSTSPPSNKPLRVWKPAREERLFLALSVVIGILSGLAVVAFRMAIDHTTRLLLGSSFSGLRLPLAPALTGHVIALLIVHVFPRVRGSGVNQTKAALCDRVPCSPWMNSTIVAALVFSRHSIISLPLASITATEMVA